MVMCILLLAQPSQKPCVTLLCSIVLRVETFRSWGAIHYGDISFRETKQKTSVKGGEIPFMLIGLISWQLFCKPGKISLSFKHMVMEAVNILDSHPESCPDLMAHFSCEL